jgi:hypothetical protein
MGRVLFLTFCFLIIVIAGATFLIGDEQDQDVQTLSTPSSNQSAHLVDLNEPETVPSGLDSPLSSPDTAQIPPTAVLAYNDPVSENRNMAHSDTPGGTPDGAKGLGSPTGPSARRDEKDWGDLDAPADLKVPVIEDLGLASSVPGGPIFGGQRSPSVQANAETAPEENTGDDPSGVARSAPSDDTRTTALTRHPPSAPPADESATSAAPTVAHVADPKIREAQGLLHALGYSPGPTDGIDGPRTRSAVKRYATTAGRHSDGTVTAALLTDMRRDVANKQQARRLAGALTSAPPPAKPEGPGFLASIVSEFQRITGREFDSRKRPADLHYYCSRNRSTWVYDSGVGDLIYCSQWLHETRFSRRSPNPSLR